MTTLNILIRTAAAAALISAWPFIASAQTTQDPHHPSGGTAAPPTAPTTQPPAAAAPGSAGQAGMMGNMGGQQGMMGGMSMMNMMGMMGQGGPGMSAAAPCGPGMGGMATIDHVEGRIAFLRTEIKITKTQTKVWDQFADAMRTNAKELGEARKTMMPQAAGGQMQVPTLSQRLDTEERWLTARLKGVSTIKVAYDHLYDALSEDQRKAAEELVAPHFGMAPMGMRPTGGAQQ